MTTDVIDLGIGEPDFDTPDAVKAAGKDAIDANFTRYTPQPGFLELREVIARKFDVENGFRVSPEQIVVSCGGKHSLFNVFQCLLGPGDEAIVFNPGWNVYVIQVGHAGAKVVGVPTTEEDGFLPQPAAVRAALTAATKAMVINSPCNPTGAVLGRELLAELGALAVENDLTIVFDEVYEKILFDGAEHVSMASLGPEIAARTVTINSVSKAHAMTGWRIGYAAMPRDLAERVTALQSCSTSGPCAVSQRAAIAALTQDGSHVCAMVAEYAKRRAYLLDRLAHLPQLSSLPPRGGFFTLINVSKLMGATVGGKLISSAADLAEALLEVARVKVTSGEFFGAPQYIRLSFAAPHETIREGMRRIEQLLAQ